MSPFFGLGRVAEKGMREFGEVLLGVEAVHNAESSGKEVFGGFPDPGRSIADDDNLPGLCGPSSCGLAFDPPGKVRELPTDVRAGGAFDGRRVGDRSGIPDRDSPLVLRIGLPDVDHLGLARLGRAVFLFAFSPGCLARLHRDPGPIHADIKGTLGKAMRLEVDMLPFVLVDQLPEGLSEPLDLLFRKPDPGGAKKQVARSQKVRLGAKEAGQILNLGRDACLVESQAGIVGEAPLPAGATKPVTPAEGDLSERRHKGLGFHPLALKEAPAGRTTEGGRVAGNLLVQARLEGPGRLFEHPVFHGPFHGSEVQSSGGPDHRLAHLLEDRGNRGGGGF